MTNPGKKLGVIALQVSHAKNENSTALKVVYKELTEFLAARIAYITMHVP